MSFSILFMPVSTECAAALLSFRYPSLKVYYGSHLYLKILLKLDKRETGLKLFGSVSSASLKIGITFANFSLEGYFPK